MKTVEETNIEKLRSDYIAVRKWWKEADEWSDADLAEADESISKAVKSENAELIECWANWLAKIVYEIGILTGRVRAAEARIRDAAVVMNG